MSSVVGALVRIPADALSERAAYQGQEADQTLLEGTVCPGAMRIDVELLPQRG